VLSAKPVQSESGQLGTPPFLVSSWTKRDRTFSRVSFDDYLGPQRPGLDVINRTAHCQAHTAYSSHPACCYGGGGGCNSGRHVPLKTSFEIRESNPQNWAPQLSFLLFPLVFLDRACG
jgi:hypothetical protein